MAAQVDPRCWWVEVQEALGYPRWRCTKVIYQDENESEGRHEIRAFLTGKDGLPVAGQRVWHDWPEEKKPLTTDASGMARVEIWANSCDPDAGRPGAYRIYADGNSDIVGKMCLPLNRHVVYLCYFVFDDAPQPPPDGNGDMRKLVADALRLAASHIEGR